MSFSEMSVTELEERKVAIGTEVEAEGADIDALTEEVRGINAELAKRKEVEDKKNEIRAAVASGKGTVVAEVKNEIGEKKMSDNEIRADELLKNGKVEIRQLLSTGTIAKPTKADGINGLGASANSIVDDVHSIALTGTGAWIAAYKDSEAEAAAVTDGSAVGGTPSAYNYVTINPSEWGVLDEISKQVKKMSPLAYLDAIEESAVIALRDEAASKIVTAVTGSSLAKAVTAALGADYLKTVVLGFRSIRGKGDVCLYLTQADLLTLSTVRGTNEKKAVYEVSFDAGTTTSGIIREGGLAVKFRVLDELSDGTQLFGQPMTIDMPMWDNYEVETDEGGDYFKRNMIGIRGLQTAGADLVAKHGMCVVSNS